jgi:hypothetical protein
MYNCVQLRVNDFDLSRTFSAQFGRKDIYRK